MLVAALSLVCFTPRPLRAADEAEDAAPEPADEGDLHVVVTDGRRPQNDNQSVMRVGVVPRVEAARRGAQNVGDAVAGELGSEVNPSAYGSLGRPAAAQIGGLDRDRVLVLEDGERVAGDFGGAVDLSKLSLSGISRIEIVSGPMSALYGTSAIGGVINVISAAPEVEGWSGRFQLEGRHRWGGQALGEIAYREGPGWVAAESGFHGSTAVVLAPPDTTIPDLYRVDTGLRAGFDLGSGHEIGARIKYAHEAARGVDGQDVPGLGTFLVDLPDSTDRFSVRLRDRLALGAGHELSLSLAKQWFWNETRRDRRDSPLDESRSRFHTMQSVEATGSFFDGEVASFLVGARGEIESFHQELTRSTLERTQVVTSERPEVVPTQLGGGATYAQVRVDPVEEIAIVLGGRIEASPRYGVAAAPRLALLVRPHPTLSLRLSGGRGYRAPSAKEVGFSFDHSVFGYRVIGNPDLSPETSWGLQGDVGWKLHRFVELRANGFANWVDDLIDLELAETSSGLTGVDDYTYVNVGAARTSGAGASIRARAHEYLRAEAGYAYLFTRDETIDRPLPGRPPHTFLVSAFTQTPIGLSLYARFRAVLDAYLEDTLRAPAFATLDVRVAQKTWPGGEAYAGVLDLLGAQKDPERAGDQRPAEGRTFYLGISSEFPEPE
jgi:outer membrane receptor for ferrienterochelin and colicins